MRWRVYMDLETSFHRLQYIYAAVASQRWATGRCDPDDEGFALSLPSFGVSSTAMVGNAAPNANLPKHNRCILTSEVIAMF